MLSGGNRKARGDSVIGLFRRGSLTRAQLGAAIEIERMLTVNGSHFSHCPALDRIGVKSRREAGQRVERTLCNRLDGSRLLQAWGTEMTARGMDLTIPTDILINGNSLRQSDRSRHRRNGHSRKHLKAALNLYLELRRRKDSKKDNIPS